MSRRPSQHRKDSWITVDWDGNGNDRSKSKPPSALHGVLDQITGRILGDHHLIQQGKREWRKASAYRRALRERNARRGGSSSNTTTTRNVGKGGGFWGAILGGASKKKRTETVKVIGSDGRARVETRTAYKSSSSRPHTTHRSRAEYSSSSRPHRSTTTTDRSRRPAAREREREREVPKVWDAPRRR